MNMSPLDPGTLVEIETAAGLAYLVVSHRHPLYGEVLRGLAGLYRERPEAPAMLARAPVQFTAMSPLSEAMAAGRVAASVIGRTALPQSLRCFPVFRMPIRDRAGGVVYWWYWDGEGLSLAPPPGAEPAALPLREITPVHRLPALWLGAGGWRGEGETPRPGMG